jgi:hypothetical protein
MKQCMKSLETLKAGLVAVVFAAVMSVRSAPPVVTPPPPVTQVPRSVFIIPSNSKEGHDPFFPASLRPYEGAPAIGGNNISDLSALVIQGVLGVAPHQLVIINNVTFGVGDDAEVRTSQGRIRIHCVAIKGNSVVVEANGVEHMLQYGEKQ